MLFVCHPKILHEHCLQLLLRVKMAPRETENNAYAKFWGDKQRALWYVMVFSGVVNKPLASSKNPHFQNETKCTTFLVKMTFICTRMKNRFRIKG